MQQLKYFKYRKLAVIVFLISSCFSCKKLLERPPNSAPFSSQYWRTANDFEGAILGTHSLLRAALMNENRYLALSDCAVRSVHGGDYHLRISRRNLSGTFPTVIDWTDYYRIISLANLIIQRGNDWLAKQSGSDAVSIKRDVGEALFLRALTYFYLTRIWGEVPIETIAYDNPIEAKQKPRAPLTEVYKQIEEDINKADEILKNVTISANDRAIRASRFSVLALSAHFNLWRARMQDVASGATDAAALEKAKNAIDQIKNSGRFFLVDTAQYKRVTLKQSSESIFEITIDESKGEGSTSHIGLLALGTYRIDPDKAVLYSGNGIYSGLSDNAVYVPNEFINKFYANTRTTDIRLPKLYDVLGPNSSRVDDFVLTKYDNFIYRDAANRMNPAMSHPIVVFRYADILLLEAEYHLYKGNNADALTILNSFRARYNNVPLASATLTNYFAERVKELHYEGHAYYDMLRTRQYAGNVDPFNGFDDAGFKLGCFYFPIPNYLFSNNPFMKQTTFWLGRL